MGDRVEGVLYAKRYTNSISSIEILRILVQDILVIAQGPVLVTFVLRTVPEIEYKRTFWNFRTL